MSFTPSYVIFRENALEYPLGNQLYKLFTKEKDIKVHKVASRGPFPFDNDISFRKKFARAKRTIVVSVRSLNKFQSCKPSAHYQLPLVTGCPAHCHYCYLSTNLGKNPYIKVYVNLEDILARAEKYIVNRKPKTTIFEGAATSDPLPVEKWTGSLASTIKYFAEKKLGRFRFVTKFTEVEPLLGIDHQKKTEFRFSLNSKYAVEKFEPTTPAPSERIKAAAKVYQAAYPLGFLIAPIFIYKNWKDEYSELINDLSNNLNSNGKGISFELITHRFTERAKRIIEEIYPETELPMNEEARQFKYGQFGYGKYIYPKEKMKEIEDFMKGIISKAFPEAEIKYFV
ncbi:spore photoproduct lyase [Iocasia frigidifontis]|uniref:Spore photoproduct lyase n=1 Tax=Iocasia fonsfrigidae TaxID=2682810 RepID=A0A8A7KP42_9FIRM|nr:spore photoproduct lyase [Iocasia fonsfrigidae]QTL99582.1 spore photoproduct lyase [Iocasia fonsfrigidae]